MSFAIITDTSSSLHKELRERFGIDGYGCGYINCSDGTSIKANLDWSEEEYKQFFTDLSKNKTRYKTSVPGIPEIAEVIEKELKAGRDVLTVNLSTGLSGMYNVFVNAAKLLKEQYPERKIICVDSLRYSVTEGMVCVLAARYRDEGKTIEETAQLLEKTKHNVRQIGWMDDLFYCKRMGRVSNSAAVMGTLVGIKPMADINKSGMSHVIGKVRGTKSAEKMIVEYMKSTGADLKNQIIFVTHSMREKEAQEVKALIEAEIGPKEVIVTTVELGSAPNIGPGLVAACYLGEPVSEDMSKETQLFREISAKI